MKTIKIHIILLLLFFSPILFSQSYLPLEPGNKWFFKHGECVGDPVFSECIPSILVSNIIVDSTTPNDYVYYKVHGIYMGFFEWFRSDTNWIYVYSLEDSLDLPIFNLHANVDEPYIYGKEEYQKTTLRRRDTLSIFNDTVEVLEFVLETGLDVTNEFTLSRKYGFIKHVNIGYGGWSYSNLIGCIINGTVYGDTSTVGINDEEEVLNEFVLNQNYPNPFNPNTKISYSLPQPGTVQLTIYNLLGSEIMNLVNEYQQAGTYEIEFDASSPALGGQALPSGVYIYTLRVIDFTASNKMIVLK